MTKSEIKQLDKLKNIDKVHIVMDNHTILHNSESLLLSLYRKYPKAKVNLHISLKDCEIPKSLKYLYNEQNDEYIKNIA